MNDAGVGYITLVIPVIINNHYFVLCPFQMKSKRLKTEREQDDLKQNVVENLTALTQNNIKGDAPSTKLRPKAPSNMSYTVSIFRVLSR
mgnify:CR=1 FL=1